MYQGFELKLIKNLILGTIIMGLMVVFTYSKERNYTLISPLRKSTNIFRIYTPVSEKKENVVYGYLPWWSLGELDYIQLDKLTDVAYFGVYLKSDGTFKKVLDEGINEPGYSKWVSDQRLSEFIRRAQVYNVRVSLTLVAHEDNVIDSFLSCTSCWEKLANNLSAEMDKHNIKDVNLNFEHGGPTTPEIANKYVEFVDFMNKYMDAKYKDSFVVTSAFADSTDGNRVSSNIKGLGQVSDGIFIMGYDYHRPVSANAGSVAPLDGIEKTVDGFLSQTSADKLILGVPYYGYNWVVDSDVLGASRVEGTDEKGYSGAQLYSSVISTINDTKSKVLWDQTAKTPYFTYKSPDTGSTRQVHFENTDSLKEKYTFTKQKSLLGVGIWALGYDGGRTELWDLLGKEFFDY